MKMIKFVSIFALVALAALVVAGYACAQGQNPPSPQAPAAPDGAPAYGQGMMGRFNGSVGGMMGRRNGGGMGMMGRVNGSGDGTYGPMHDSMVAAFAEALGMSVEDVNAALADGETMWTLAEAQGMTQETFAQVMLDARTQALDDAVAAGTITQEQADLMRSHWETMSANGYGPGGAFCDGTGRGMMGGGRGRNFQAPAQP